MGHEVIRDDTDETRGQATLRHEGPSAAALKALTWSVTSTSSVRSK